MSSRRKTADDIAIPLCLPNNCRWNAATGYCDKTGEQRHSLYVVESALQKLRTVKGPVCVVSIAGQYRRGKSYILAEAFDQPDVFPLGHNFDPETMGIWMWIVPQKFQLSNGQECTVVLLDSEGIDAVVGEGLDDHEIFTLTVLLASVMIYNSTGVPTRHDLDGLDFIVKLSERIQLRSSNDGNPSMGACRKDTEFFHKTFPFFMWLLRDVAQSIPPDCEDIKEYFLKRVFKDQRRSDGDNAQKVAESILRFFPGFQAISLPPPSADGELLRNMNSNKSRLNPCFLSGLEQFKQLLRSVLIPKYSFNEGEIVTGLAALVQLYVDAINTPGVIPNVQTAWETFVMTKCSEACEESLKLYDATMNAELSGKLPCDSDFIRVKHELGLQKGVALLEKETFGISAITTEKYWKKLTGSFDEKLGWWQLENGKLTRAACVSLLKNLKEEHLDPVLARLREEGARMSFDDIIQGYKRIEQDFNADAKGAKHVCAEVFYEFHPPLMEEMKQYLGVLQQLKDFDEKASLEMAARAYQEQEVKKLEEQQARLEQERRERQMEMEKQQRKFEEEKKRLQEQMEADVKAQQKQIKNMMKANMQRAEQDRIGFIRENQALNARLLEMERLNQENQREIVTLNGQIRENRGQQNEVRKPGFRDKSLQVVTGVALASLIASGAVCNVM
ncbi:guanylate-binding protein 6-like isoform X2 [Montipora foliosa]|uniref:guanylate-binding protein 6-like isoform X2 n=1 Tax=Montipora foliosa TaxID=591990 RepID=UPI0035F2039B